MNATASDTRRAYAEKVLACIVEATGKGHTVFVSTMTKVTAIKAKHMVMAGHPMFKIATDGSLLMIEGWKAGKPRYTDATGCGFRARDDR